MTNVLAQLAFPVISRKKCNLNSANGLHVFNVARLGVVINHINHIMSLSIHLMVNTDSGQKVDFQAQFLNPDTAL